MDPEQWLPVVRFEGLYEVSNLGRVRSVDRVVDRPHPVLDNQTLTRRGALKTLTQQPLGYMGVMLYSGGKAHPVRVHRLVLEAFVGSCPAGMETRHLNGRRDDNRLINLAWGTHQENFADQVRHGTANWRSAAVTLGDPLCSRGHRLVAPNVRQPPGRRACLACLRANSGWRSYARTHPAADRQTWVATRANENYRRIMAAAAAH